MSRGRKEKKKLGKKRIGEGGAIDTSWYRGRKQDSGRERDRICTRRIREEAPGNT